ncbi:MAG: cytochrome c [Halobacteria archaeon]|nr:cytochrome c [Halobacteria archaeon]
MESSTALHFVLPLPFFTAMVVAEPTPQRQAELVHLLRHDCGSCHGMTLKGGLGPALTPDALVNKPPDYLLQTVRDGHFGTPMPPWKGILSEDEMRFLVGILLRGTAQ